MTSAGEGSFTISGTPFVRRDVLNSSEAMSNMESIHPNDTEKWGDNIRLELSIDSWIAGFDRTHFELNSDDNELANYSTFQYKFSIGRRLLNGAPFGEWARFCLNASASAGFSEEGYVYNMPYYGLDRLAHIEDHRVPLVGAELAPGVFFGEDGFRIGVQIPVGIETRPNHDWHTTVSAVPSAAARIEF